MKIRDVMSAPVVTVGVNDCLKVAVDITREQGFRHLPVVDSKGAIVGVLSDRDLRDLIVVYDESTENGEDYWIPSYTGIREVMADKPVVVSPGVDVREAVRIMREGRFSCIPVLSTGRLVGIVTSTDLLDTLSSSK